MLIAFCYDSAGALKAAALVLFVSACLAGCSVLRSAGSAPGLLLGEWSDDYGNRFVISRSEWQQLPNGRYHIHRWNPDQQYLIAQNDSGNVSAGGRWTRIDWAPLEGMPPYTWAFCLSAYDAPSAQAAERTTIVRRDSLRTGCNGFPFSRMRRISR